MISERAGEAGAQAGPAPAPRLAIVTLDGSLLGAASAGQASGERCGGAAPVRHRSRQQCVQPAASSDRNSRRWRARGQAGELLLDKGASETALISTLRTHYVRNSTAESACPPLNAAPNSACARTGSDSRDHGGSPGPAPSSSAAQQKQVQEQELWEGREEELVDAQLEAALAAREAKRGAYLAHRLEASAAQKAAQHRRRQQAAARQRVLAVHHAQHMPSLKQAVAAAMPASRADAMQKLAGRPAFPASRAASAMVARASASIASLPAISTLQAGLEAGAAFPLGTAAVHSGRLAQGAARATRLDKQRSAAAAHVEDVYCRMQAVKALGGSLLSPLDAARAAADPTGGVVKAPLAAERAAAQHRAREEGEASCASGLAAVYEAQQEEAGSSPLPIHPVNATLDGLDLEAEGGTVKEPAAAAEAASGEGELSKAAEPALAGTGDAAPEFQPADAGPADQELQTEATVKRAEGLLSANNTSSRHSRRSSTGCEVYREAGSRDAANMDTARGQKAELAGSASPGQTLLSLPPLQTAHTAHTAQRAGEQVNLSCAEASPPAQQLEEQQADSPAGEQPACSSLQPGQAEEQGAAAVLQAAAMEGLHAAVAALLQGQQEQESEQARQQAALEQGPTASSPAGVAGGSLGEEAAADGTDSQAGHAQHAAQSVADGGEGVTAQSSADLLSGGPAAI